METAKSILRQSGLESVAQMAPNERCTVRIADSDVDRLVLEKVGPSRLSVAHRRVQSGTPVSDPEVVFRIEGDRWIPIEYTRDPAVHQYDPTGLDVGSLLRRWDETISRQGFLDAADPVESGSDPDRKPEYI